MEQTIREALTAMGADVSEVAQNEFLVTFPDPVDMNDPIEKLNGRVLSFNAASVASHSELVSKGSRIMDDIASALSKSGSCRHWRVPPSIEASRKCLRSKIEFWMGDIVKFSVKKNWQAVLVCHFKITFSNYELLEELVAIKIQTSGPPRIVSEMPTPSPDWEIIRRPAVKKAEIKKMVEAAREKARWFVVERAESFRESLVKSLYKTIQQIRRYYEQIKKEALTSNNEVSFHDIESEYRFRKGEEIEKASVRAVIELVALETISVPISMLTYEAKNGESARIVTSLVSLKDGTILNAVTCEACQMESTTLGLSKTGQLVCPACHAICHSCGKEVIAPNAREAAKCSHCSKHFCEKHSLVCDSCKQLVCTDHAEACAAGCHICGSCARECVECGNHVVWCKDHVYINHKNEAVCRDHVLYCSGCKEPYSSERLQNCSRCGQLVCSSCREVCRGCGKTFCLNHIENGRCEVCESMMDEEKEEQMTLF
ncbi:MAG: hypothetical protein JW925_14310 [Syntrophaceae bacterium]|nr:hypothetical protein [Syntrophaceae bacterium]